MRCLLTALDQHGKHGPNSTLGHRPKYLVAFNAGHAAAFQSFRKRNTNTQKKVRRDRNNPTDVSRVSRGSVCPADILSNLCGITHNVGRDVPDVPGLAPKPLGHFRGIPTTKFLCVFFVCRFFLLPTETHHQNFQFPKGIFRQASFPPSRIQIFAFGGSSFLLQRAFEGPKIEEFSRPCPGLKFQGRI